MERSKASLSRSNLEPDDEDDEDDKEMLRNGDFGESRCTKSSEKPTFVASEIGKTKEFVSIKKQDRIKIPEEFRAMTKWIVIVFKKRMKKKLRSFCYFYREKKGEMQQGIWKVDGNNTKIECSQGE